MLGIRGKLFALSLAVIGLTVLVLNVLVSYQLRAHLQTRMARDLAVRASLIVRALRDPQTTQDLPRAAEELGREAGVRVAFVGADGVVIESASREPPEGEPAESDSAMPEVQEALRHGTGVAERAHDRAGEWLYVAEAAPATSPVAVVRLGASLEPVRQAVSRARELLLGGTLLAVLVAGVLSSIGSFLLSRSVRELRAAAEAMTTDLTVRTRLRGGDEVGALGQSLDRLAENLSSSLERMESERDQLEAILETIVEGVLVTDAEGRIAMANRALRAMLGTAGRLVGRVPIESIRSAELAELIATVSRTHAVRSAELDVAGIAPRRLRVQAAPLSGGGQRGVVAVFSDLTELRRLESIRRDFVANVSHELRTPIAAVLAAAETLEVGALRDPRSAEEFVQIIGRHARRLKDIVEDLLALSRIESQKLDLVTEPIELRDLFEHIADLYATAASRHNAGLSIEVTPPTLSVMADRRAVEQVVSNLVDNAVKYAPRSKVVLGALENGDAVSLFVRDEGPGIPPQHLSRVFERFYRVDKGRSRDVGGTGLGLSIVKHLTEAMGGKVTVESAVGRGSTFNVQLPRAGKNPVAIAGAASDPPPEVAHGIVEARSDGSIAYES